MKALPLWQPWASLVAIGAKRIETRHWPAPKSLIGQRIAIHATKGTGPGGARAFRDLCRHEPFRSALEREGLAAAELPRGGIIATAILDRCVVMKEEEIDTLSKLHPDEHAFGNYEPGRYAWILSELVQLPELVPFKGSQGVFEVPRSLVSFKATINGSPV